MGITTIVEKVDTIIKEEIIIIIVEVDLMDSLIIILEVIEMKEGDLIEEAMVNLVIIGEGIKEIVIMIIKEIITENKEMEVETVEMVVETVVEVVLEEIGMKDKVEILEIIEIKTSETGMAEMIEIIKIIKTLNKLDFKGYNQKDKKAGHKCRYTSKNQNLPFVTDKLHNTKLI
jgi:hypothetical protein